MSKDIECSIAYEIEGISNFPVSYSVLNLVRFQRTLVSEALREIGLFPGQELLLMQLWTKDCQPQTALGKALQINHSTVAKSVKRLEESGLIVRKRSDEDKRITNICLTPEGEKLKDKVFHVWHEVENDMTANLSPEEQQLLIGLIKKII